MFAEFLVHSPERVFLNHDADTSQRRRGSTSTVGGRIRLTATVPLGVIDLGTALVLTTTTAGTAAE